MLQRQQAKVTQVKETSFQQQRAHAQVPSVDNRSRALMEQAGPGAMRLEGAR